jgi:glycosyltransferase involved in cell wall biosynthesis
VVDDGSTDASRSIIAEYRQRVVSVFKSNGGQASAFDAGLKASRGEVIFFLDADDILLPNAVARAIEHFDDAHVAKVHWPLRIVNAVGQPTGQTLPPSKDVLPEGDLRDIILSDGPDSYLSSPSSGNAWSRAFLKQVLPAPEEQEYRQGADGYLSTLAPLFGTVRAVHEPLALYRSHGSNQYWSGGMDKRIQGSLIRYDRRCRTLLEIVRQRGWQTDVDAWKTRNVYYQWMCKIDQTLRELAFVADNRQKLILVDENQCGGANALSGRRVLPFLERDGQYWGPPADDAVAIRELDRMRNNAASLIAFAWPAFWWMEHYKSFARHLHENYPCVLNNERLKVFTLGKAKA